jgi:hypothetical protein
MPQGPPPPLPLASPEAAARLRAAQQAWENAGAAANGGTDTAAPPLPQVPLTFTKAPPAGGEPAGRATSPPLPSGVAPPLPETALGAGARGDVEAVERALREAFARAAPGASPAEQALREVGPPIQTYRGTEPGFFYGDPRLVGPLPGGEWARPLPSADDLAFQRQEAAKKGQLSATLAALQSYAPAYQGQAHLAGEAARMAAEYGPGRTRRDIWNAAYTGEFARSNDPEKAKEAADIAVAGLPDLGSGAAPVPLPPGAPGAGGAAQGGARTPLVAGGGPNVLSNAGQGESQRSAITPKLAEEFLTTAKVRPEQGKTATELNAAALADALYGNQEFAGKGLPSIAHAVLTMGLSPESIIRDLDTQLIRLHNEATGFAPTGAYGPYTLKATYEDGAGGLLGSIPGALNRQGEAGMRKLTGYTVTGGPGGVDWWHGDRGGISKFSDFFPTIRDQTKKEYAAKALLLAKLREQIGQRLASPLQPSPLPPVIPAR